MRDYYKLPKGWKRVHEWHRPDGLVSLSVLSKGNSIFDVSWAAGTGLTKIERFDSLDDAMNFVAALSRSKVWAFLQKEIA